MPWPVESNVLSATTLTESSILPRMITRAEPRICVPFVTSRPMGTKKSLRVFLILLIASMGVWSAMLKMQLSRSFHIRLDYKDYMFNIGVWNMGGKIIDGWMHNHSFTAGFGANF